MFVASKSALSLAVQAVTYLVEDIINVIVIESIENTPRPARTVNIILCWTVFLNQQNREATME